jgi:hypothetical protein
MALLASASASLLIIPYNVLYLNPADLCNQFLGPGVQWFQAVVLDVRESVDLLDETLGACPVLAGIVAQCAIAENNFLLSCIPETRNIRTG